MPILFFPQPPDELLAVLPRDTLDRKVLLPFEAAKVVPHDRLPPLLRDKMNPKVETLGQRDLVRGFVVHPVRFLPRTPHCECPSRYPDELHAEAVRDAAAKFWLRCGRRQLAAVGLCQSTDLDGSTFIPLAMRPIRSITDRAEVDHQLLSHPSDLLFRQVLDQCSIQSVLPRL